MYYVSLAILKKMNSATERLRKRKAHKWNISVLHYSQEMEAGTRLYSISPSVCSLIHSNV